MILLLVGFLCYIELVWAPEYLGKEREDYIAHYMMEVDILAQGLSPILGNGDYESAFKALDGISASYPMFLEVKLETDVGEVLYRNGGHPGHSGDLQIVSSNLSLSGRTLTLSLLVDVGAQMRPEVDALRMPLKILGAALLVIIMMIVYFHSRWVSAPLVRLSRAAKALAKGVYDVTLPTSSNDELGVLVKAFDSMRNEIRTTEWELRYENDERRKTEAALQYDMELQYALDTLLRLSLNATSVTGLLNNALDVILGITWLAVEKKGSIFMMDESGGTLRMHVQRNMPDNLLRKCQSVPIGKCLCGAAAESRQMVVSQEIDDRHEIRFEGMEPHGHVIVPIMDNADVRGVINLYLHNGQTVDVIQERALLRLADAIAIGLDKCISRQRLMQQAQVLDQVRDAIIGIDAHHRLVIWNKGAQRLFGYEEQEILGKSAGELLQQDDSADGENGLYQILSQGLNEVDTGMMKRGKIPFTASLSIAERKNPEDKQDGFIIHVADVTEIRRIQNEAMELNRDLEQQVRQRARDVLNQKNALDQHSIVGVTDKAGRIIYANDKFCDISGYSREELLGQDHRILNSGFHSHEFFKNMWKTIGRGAVWHGEIRNRRKDGSHYWVDTTIVPFMDDSGKPYEYVSIRTDITDHKRLLDEKEERNLRLHHQQEALLKITQAGVFNNENPLVGTKLVFDGAVKAINSERAGIWLLNADGMQLHLDAYSMYGVVHYGGDTTIHYEDYPDYFNALSDHSVIAADDVFADNRTRSLASGYLSQHGVLSMLAVPIWVSGKLKGAFTFEISNIQRNWSIEEKQFAIMVADMVALIMEQANRREAERRLADTVQQLKIANRQLDNALVEARSAASLKSEFLAVMSHEVRTPMNGIMGMLEILSDADLGEENNRYASIAYGSASALLELLNDVLDYSRIESGQVRVENMAYDPTLIIEEVVRMMRPLADANKVQLSADLVALPASVEGDPLRFRQIVTNLVSNAIKFTREGEVQIRGGITQDLDSVNMVHIEILDTGIGISEKDQARIFDAFSQADSSISRRYGGSGLGLAICRKLVRMMGGNIGVKSTPGQGSCFWFDLPADGKVGAKPGKAA